MKQGQRLNLKWSIADTDMILRFAREERMTDLQIVKRLKMLGRDATREEVCNICSSPGYSVKIGQRPA